MSIQFMFTTVPFSGYQLMWGYDHKPKTNYHKYHIEGVVIFHMEDGKVVEDYVNELTPYNFKDWNVLDFEGIKDGAKVPVHKNLSVKSIAKEQLFISHRDTDTQYTKEWLFIHKDLIGLSYTTLKKRIVHRSPFKIDSANFEIVKEVNTAFGIFIEHVRYDLNDYQAIRWKYEEVMKEHEYPQYILDIEVQIKILQAEMKDLQDCMNKWRDKTAIECLRKPTISWGNLVKGGE